MQIFGAVASQAINASGQVVPNLMDVALAALNESVHPDEKRVTLGRVRILVRFRCFLRESAGDRASLSFQLRSQESSDRGT